MTSNTRSRSHGAVVAPHLPGFGAPYSSQLHWGSVGGAHPPAASPTWASAQLSVHASPGQQHRLIQPPGHARPGSGGHRLVGNAGSLGRSPFGSVGSIGAPVCSVSSAVPSPIGSVGSTSAGRASSPGPSPFGSVASVGATSSDGDRFNPSRSDGSAGSGRLVGLRAPRAADAWGDEEISRIFQRIDADGNGWVSKLELIDAAVRDPLVCSMILPGISSDSVMRDESSFDAADALFDSIAGGKQRIRLADFVAHFRKAVTPPAGKESEVRSIYSLIDADGSGSISKLEMVAAVMRNPQIADFLLPGVDAGSVLSNEETFDAVNAVFDAISGGKQRIYLQDLEKHFCHTAPMPPMAPSGSNRRHTRVFVIGPGFGQQLNPRQGAMLRQAGFQVHFCHGIPNPEVPNFHAGRYLEHIRREMDAFRPHVVTAASKGGIYLVRLWEAGLWRGPSLLINAHPSCRTLPEDVPVVIAQGSNDEVYGPRRADVERLVSTGSPNKCLLYYTANSGRMRGGQFTRMGDRHNMESLLLYDCLPRLLDAAICPEGPEMHLIRTWQERLGADRREAEAWLGLTPERLRARWARNAALRRQRVSDGDDRTSLQELPRHSEEFRCISTVFHSVPAEPPAYVLSPQANWDRTRILKIERVENALQHEGCIKPYFESLRRSLEDQGYGLEPGVHTLWGFHGATNESLESIVSNPVAGFVPLASGTRNSTLWGPGTYFARDAKYVADGGFCGAAAPDGSRQMLMCLLMTGMPCLGDPEHHGVLPMRQKPHRYHSAVDSLSSPEIYVTQHPGAAAPGYLITFK